MDDMNLISLKLYNEDNEVIRELTRAIVPWGIMKRAMELGTKLEKSTDVIEISDAVTDFICMVFSDKVTRQELEDFADAGDMLNIFRAIMNKANGLGKTKAAAKSRPK